MIFGNRLVVRFELPQWVNLCVNQQGEEFTDQC